MYSCSLAIGRTAVIWLGAATPGNSARTRKDGVSASAAAASSTASSAPATTADLLLIILVTAARAADLLRRFDRVAGALGQSAKQPAHLVFAGAGDDEVNVALDNRATWSRSGARGRIAQQGAPVVQPDDGGDHDDGCGFAHVDQPRAPGGVAGAKHPGEQPIDEQRRGGQRGEHAAEQAGGYIETAAER